MLPMAIGAILGKLGGALKQNLTDDKGFFQGGKSFGGEGIAGIGQKLAGALGGLGQQQAPPMQATRGQLSPEQTQSFQADRGIVTQGDELARLKEAGRRRLQNRLGQGGY